MDEDERIERLVEGATGASVSRETLSEPVGSRKLHALLADDEQPHHVLRGRVLDTFDLTAGAQVEDSQTRKIPSKGQDLFTVLTDRRVLILVGRPDDPDRVSVPLAEFSEATHEAALGTNTRLRLSTDDRAYLVDTSQSEETHVEAASEFVNERQDGPGDTAAAGPGTGVDVFEAIERLADLHERGALTDEEFAEKKRELLDRL